MSPAFLKKKACYFLSKIFLKICYKFKVLLDTWIRFVKITLHALIILVLGYCIVSVKNNYILYSIRYCKLLFHYNRYSIAVTLFFKHGLKFMSCQS